MDREPFRSFRDPCGHVAVTDSGVFRFITEAGAADFAAVEQTGLLAALTQAGRLWPYQDAAPQPEAGRHSFAIRRTLSHPPLPFVSYPYEWSFSALRRAALFHLDVQIEALDAGVVLKDATPFNIQFVNGAPVFIDHLSFEPYRDGTYWLGHAQFHNQFFGPLLLEQATGVPCSTFYRGNPEGLSAHEINRLLPLRSRLSPYAFANISLSARLAQRTPASSQSSRRPLPKSAYRALLVAARRAVERLNSGISASNWGDYAGNNSYSDTDAGLKHRFIVAAMAQKHPMQVWDIGCNTGDYALTALKAGAAFVVGVDSDALAIDRAFRRAETERLPFLPLVADFAAPTPGLGWLNRERPGLLERARADFVLALAVIHHLVFGRNVPLRDAISALVALAPAGVIEFVPPSDPMVRKIAAGREALFPDYTEDGFRRFLQEKATILDETRVTVEGRTLVHYERLQ